MSIGDDGAGAAEALAQMNISKANLVDATGLLKYDMFPHGWVRDSTSDFLKTPVIKYEILSDVQPVFEDEVNGKAGYNFDAVLQLHRWRHGNRPLRTPSKRHAVSNCPHQEAAKQHGIGEHAGRDEMRHSPDHDAEQHWMLESVFNATGKICGEKQGNHRKHENGRDVMSPSWGRV